MAAATRSQSLELAADFTNEDAALGSQSRARSSHDGGLNALAGGHKERPSESRGVPADSSKSADTSREGSRRGSISTSEKSPPPPPPTVTPTSTQVLHSGVLKKKGAIATTSKFYVLTKDVFACYGTEKDFKKGVSGTVTLLSAINNITSEKETLNYIVKSTAKPVQLLASSEAEASLWCEYLNDAWAAGGNDELERPNSGGDSDEDELKGGIQDEDGMFSATLEAPEATGLGKKSRRTHSKIPSLDGAERKKGRSKRHQSVKKKEPVPAAAPAEDLAFDADFETAFEPAFDKPNEPIQVPDKRNSLSSGPPRSPRVSLSCSFVGGSTHTNLSPCPSPTHSVSRVDPNPEDPRSSSTHTSNTSLISAATVATSPSTIDTPLSTVTTPPSATTALPHRQPQSQSPQDHLMKSTELEFADFSDFAVEDVTTRPSSVSTSSTTTTTFHTVASTSSPSSETTAPCSSSSCSSSFSSGSAFSFSAPTTTTTSTSPSPSPRSSCRSSNTNFSSCTSNSSSSSLPVDISPPSSRNNSVAHRTPDSPKLALSSRKARSGIHTPSIISALPPSLISHPAGSTSHQLTSAEPVAAQPSEAATAPASGTATTSESRFRKNSFVQFEFVHSFGLKAPNWDVIMETDFEELEEVDEDTSSGKLQPSSQTPQTPPASEPSPEAAAPMAPPGKQGLRLSNVGLAPGSAGSTLQDVLDDPEGAELLRKYAVETFDTENLDFLEEVQAYQKLVQEGKTQDALKQAKSICEQFVSEAGIKSLNLNSKLRAQQSGIWKGQSPDFLEGSEFDASVKEVKFLLATNQFLRFKKTPLCINWEKKAAARILEHQKAAAVLASSKFSEGRASAVFSSAPRESTIKVSTPPVAAREITTKEATSATAGVLARAASSPDTLKGIFEVFSSLRPKSNTDSSHEGAVAGLAKSASSHSLKRGPISHHPRGISVVLSAADFDGFEDMKPAPSSMSPPPPAHSRGASRSLGPPPADGVSNADIDAFFSSFEQTKREHFAATFSSPSSSSSAASSSGTDELKGCEELFPFLQDIELGSVHAILVANGVKDVHTLAASQMADLKRWGISSSHSIKLLKASRAKCAPPRPSISSPAGASPLQPAPPPPSGELASVMGGIDWIKELNMKPSDKGDKKEGRLSSLRRSLLGKKPIVAGSNGSPVISGAKLPPPPPLLTAGSLGHSQPQLSTGSSEEMLIKPYLEALGLAEQATLDALEAHGIRTTVHLSSCPVNKLKAIGIPMGPAVKIVHSFQ